MRLLDDADWITKHYRLRRKSEADGGPFATDLATVKTALIEAITRTHLDQPNRIAEPRKRCCAQFLKPHHKCVHNQLRRPVVLGRDVQYGPGRTGRLPSRRG